MLIFFLIHPADGELPANSWLVGLPDKCGPTGFPSSVVGEWSATRNLSINGILGISSGARSVAVALHFPAGNSAEGPAVAPCVVLSCQTIAVRDSQHRRAIVHVHRSRRVR